jgi:hypothetical protein
MIVTTTTWKAFIADHPGKDDLDANMAAISAAFSPSKTPTELFEMALGTDPSIFLVLPFETVAPTVIHHVSKVFQSPISEAEHFCLMGWNESAAAIKINPDNFFGKLVSNQLEGEPSNKVKKIDTEILRSRLDKREFGDETGRVIQGESVELRKCIPLVPSIASLFVDIESSDPHEIGVILAEKVATIERDRNNKLHKLITSEIGKDTINEILIWLWYAPRLPEIKVNCPMAYHGSKIDRAARKMHIDKIGGIQGQGQHQHKEFAEVIARALNNHSMTIDSKLSRQIAAVQELTESKRDDSGVERSSSSSEKGFLKLPTITQKFLLAIASEDLENPAMELPKSGLDMLNMSQKHAAITLPNLIRANGHSCKGLSPSFIQDVTSIDWFDNGNPFTGLSTCRIAPLMKSLPSSSLSAKKAKKLNLLERLEIDRHEVLDELMDDSLFRPTGMEDVIRNIETILGILEIYLGAQSAVVQRMVDFVSIIRRKQEIFDIMAIADENFLTRIQFSFDRRLNEWMDGMYQHSSNLMEVDHSLINFATIDHNIKHDSFFVTLPTCLRPASKKRPADEMSTEKTTTHHNTGSNNVQTERQKKLGTVNKDINPDWKLRDGEAWEIFNKDPNNLRPSSVCFMFHILGHCPQGEKCRRAKSHMKLTNATQIKQTNEFIENCRKNAKP